MRGGIEIAFLQICCPQVGAVAGIVGPQTKSRFKFGNGGWASPVWINARPRLLCASGSSGSQLHRASECCDRTLDVSGALQHYTELGLGFGEFGCSLTAVCISSMAWSCWAVAASSSTRPR